MTGGTGFTGLGVGSRMLSLEIRGVPRIFSIKTRVVQGFFPWKSGALGFFPRHVMRPVVFDTHNSFDMKAIKVFECLEN